MHMDLYKFIQKYSNYYIVKIIMNLGSVCGLKIIFGGNEHGDTSSNPGRERVFAFPIAIIPSEKMWIQLLSPLAMGK